MFSNLFCLGEPWCSVWNCCDRADIVEPPRKKSRKGPPNPATSRFSAPTSPSKMRKICEGYVPRNTGKATDWAVRVFQDWRTARNKSVGAAEQCPETLLEKPIAEPLNYWLSRFVVEVRREDGNPYPPSSISNNLAGLYRYTKALVRTCPNFMNRKERRASAPW